jgi:hypothetical protein
VVKEDDLVIGTHGRSFWILYGIDQLRQLTQEVMNADAFLFQPTDVRRGLDSTVDVAYYLSEEAEEVEITFFSESNGTEETFTGQAAGDDEEAEEGEEQSFRQTQRRPSPRVREGLNRFRWNMRLDGYTDFEGRIFWAAGNTGPAIVPGEYKVRLTVDGTVVGTSSFNIGIDPRIAGVTTADLQARFDLAVQVRDRVSQANETVILIRELKAQVDDRLANSDDGDLAAAANDFQTALSAVEGEIYQVRNRSNQDPLNFPIKLNNKLAALLGVVEGSENRPTEQSYEVFQYLSDLLDAELETLRDILQNDMPSLNQRLDGLGLDPVVAGDVG